MSTEPRREDNTINQKRSFCLHDEHVIIREASSENSQLLALLEEESTAPQKQLPIKIDLSAVDYDGSIQKPKPSRHQRKLLVNLLGNPFTPESEWLKICELLGDEARIPHLKPLRRRKMRALALALIIAPLSFYATTHLEKTFAKSVSPTIAAFNTSWGQYQETMQYEIARSWIPSSFSEGEAISLIFKVNEDGTTGPIRLGQSERASQDWQSDAFRLSCVRAILNARLNPPPGGLSGKEVECVFQGHGARPFSFERILSSGEKLVTISGVPGAYSDQGAIFLSK